MKIALFIIGFIIGSIGGMMTMCLVQVNRVSEERLMKEAAENEKAEHQKTDMGK